MAETAQLPTIPGKIPASDEPEIKAQDRGELETLRAEANKLVEDIVLKNYLFKLKDLDVIPLNESLKKIDDICIFKITEMVYQTDEYSTYKFASVFNSVQHLNCGVFVIANSDKQTTEFYMGVRSLDEREARSLKETLSNALCGQFPGVKTDNLFKSDAEEFLKNIPSSSIAAVSCVAQNKDEEFTDNKRFLQGLEKLALAMQGRCYTAVVLARSVSADQLAATRSAYETIYTQLSPFANMQVSYGTNKALNISNSFTSGSSWGTSHSTNTSTTEGTGYSISKGTNESKTLTKSDNLAKKIGAVALGAVGGAVAIAAAPLTGGASIAAMVAVSASINAGLGVAKMAVDMIPDKTKSETRGTSENESWSKNSSQTSGESDSENYGENKSKTVGAGLSEGTSDNVQLTIQNKSLIDTLERIDLQLERIEECESVGMWGCAAYFLSDSAETAEMAAGTYKALMKGEKSGVETSAVSVWRRGGNSDADRLNKLREYVTNFIHPEFAYRAQSVAYPVTAASLVSGNELAILMGLPRKSVCGFPVIEHADFGKEVVKYDKDEYGKVKEGKSIEIGKIFSMGEETKTEVRLDCESFTKHTFVTGSTGSGKSNTVYEILHQLRGERHRIPFLVIEPAKGEYKNIFGQDKDVAVYGTNPKKTKMLRINPFRFPSDIHVLEHLDRLVELFNVCWPMYAAMPAILKDAMEKAYEEAGWNLAASENPNGEVFPSFKDLLEQIENVINESKYSADSKGDYSGALCTRVSSLTNGLNALIFCNEDLPDAALFDRCAIVDLSRVGSTETKSLIMGLLVMKLNEYRSSSNKGTNIPLSHITVLEEAHNLLKRTSTEQSSEGSNLLGKSVELLANSIAEMRTYGEGFIIADQSPGLLDMSVIRNTNTKIILRLPEQSDRELVGFSANLNKEQITELSKLGLGVAAVYQNDWVEPILVKVNRCELNDNETPYDGSAHIAKVDLNGIRRQIVYMLIQGMVKEHLDFDVSEIEKNMGSLNLSSGSYILLKRQVAEFKTKKSLSIWQEKISLELSQQVVDVLDVRSRVANNVSGAGDDNFDLCKKLTSIVKQTAPNVTENVTKTIILCLMADYRVGRDKTDLRQKRYDQWYEFINGGKR